MVGAMFLSIYLDFVVPGEGRYGRARTGLQDEASAKRPPPEATPDAPWHVPAGIRIDQLPRLWILDRSLIQILRKLGGLNLGVSTSSGYIHCAVLFFLKTTRVTLSKAAPSGARLTRRHCIQGLHLNLPALGGGHPGPIGSLSHESAGWRAIGNEDHPAGYLPVFSSVLFAGERSFPVLRTNPDSPSRQDSDLFHVIGMHDECGDHGLIFGVVFADVDLPSLLGRATGIHDEAFTRHRYHLSV